MIKTLQITVYGKVQGVWFRKYTKEKATALKLHGYVTNLNNGTVFIEVHDNSAKVNDFIHWLENEGSPLSVVSKVEIKKSITYDNRNSFDIKKAT